MGQTTNITYRGEIVTTTCWCGIRHGVPRELHDYMNEQHRNGERQVGIYCPLGHSWIFSGKSEVEKMREEQERLERVVASRAESLRIAREQRDAAERSNRALKGVVTKTRKRVGNGTCPCCNRHFANVERHMTTKHPEYAAPSSPPVGSGS